MVAATLCLILLGISSAQESNGDDEFIRKASFSIETKGARLNFVLLKNKTVDILFSGPSKYSIRARANASTTFYVQGRAKKTHTFEPSFEFVQNGQQIITNATNIKNFKKGPVEEGEDIQGLVQLVQNLNLYHPFHIKDSKNNYPEFLYDFDFIEGIEK